MSDSSLTLSWKPGVAVTAYLISALGCYCALQITKHRTGRWGTRNWIYLLLSGLSLGWCGIWNAHYVANLGMDVEGTIIRYRSGYVAGSFLIAVSLMTLGIFVADNPDNPKVRDIVIGSFISATGLLVTHSLATMGMRTTADMEYDKLQMLAPSIILALIAMFSLGLFFLYQLDWAAKWQLHLLCAAVFAATTQGVHYTGWFAITFRQKAATDNPAVAGQPGIAFLPIAIVGLVFSSCLLIFSLRQFRSAFRREHAKTHSLILTTLFFDETGRVLVTPAGTLPGTLVDPEHVPTGTETWDMFNKDFLRILRLSYRWGEMQSFVKQTLAEDISDTSRDLFTKLVGAVQFLATTLRIDCSELGLMYPYPVVIEGDPTGVMLVLCNCISSKRANHFSSVGSFRWVARDVIEPLLYRNYGPNRDEFLLDSQESDSTRDIDEADDDIENAPPRGRVSDRFVSASSVGEHEQVGFLSAHPRHRWIDQVVDFYNSTVRPLRVVGGLHIGLLYLKISPQAIQVLVPSRHRSMVPLARIRDDVTLGPEEEHWLQQLPVFHPAANLAVRAPNEVFPVPPKDPNAPGLQLRNLSKFQNAFLSAVAGLCIKLGSSQHLQPKYLYTTRIMDLDLRGQLDGTECQRLRATLESQHRIAHAEELLQRKDQPAATPLIPSSRAQPSASVYATRGASDTTASQAKSPTEHARRTAPSVSFLDTVVVKVPSAPVTPAPAPPAAPASISAAADHDTESSVLEMVGGAEISDNRPSSNRHSENRISRSGSPFERLTRSGDAAQNEDANANDSDTEADPSSMSSLVAPVEPAPRNSVSDKESSLRSPRFRRAGTMPLSGARGSDVMVPSLRISEVLALSPPVLADSGPRSVPRTAKETAKVTSAPAAAEAPVRSSATPRGSLSDKRSSTPRAGSRLSLPRFLQSGSSSREMDSASPRPSPTAKSDQSQLATPRGTCSIDSGFAPLLIPDSLDTATETVRRRAFAWLPLLLQRRNSGGDKDAARRQAEAAAQLQASSRPCAVHEDPCDCPPSDDVPQITIDVAPPSDARPAATESSLLSIFSNPDAAAPSGAASTTAAAASGSNASRVATQRTESDSHVHSHAHGSGHGHGHAHTGSSHLSSSLPSGPPILSSTGSVKGGRCRLCTLSQMFAPRNPDSSSGTVAVVPSSSGSVGFSAVPTGSSGSGSSSMVGYAKTRVIFFVVTELAPAGHLPTGYSSDLSFLPLPTFESMHLYSHRPRCTKPVSSEKDRDYRKDVFATFARGGDKRYKSSTRAQASTSSFLGRKVPLSAPAESAPVSTASTDIDGVEKPSLASDSSAHPSPSLSSIVSRMSDPGGGPDLVEMKQIDDDELESRSRTGSHTHSWSISVTQHSQRSANHVQSDGTNAGANIGDLHVASWRPDANQHVKATSDTGDLGDLELGEIRDSHSDGPGPENARVAIAKSASLTFASFRNKLQQTGSTRTVSPVVDAQDPSTPVRASASLTAFRNSKSGPIVHSESQDDSLLPRVVPVVRRLHSATEADGSSPHAASRQADQVRGDVLGSQRRATGSQVSPSVRMSTATAQNHQSEATRRKPAAGPNNWLQLVLRDVATIDAGVISDLSHAVRESRTRLSLAAHVRGPSLAQGFRSIAADALSDRSVDNHSVSPTSPSLEHRTASDQSLAEIMPVPASSLGAASHQGPAVASAKPAENLSLTVPVCPISFELFDVCQFKRQKSVPKPIEAHAPVAAPVSGADAVSASVAPAVAEATASSEDVTGICIDDDYKRHRNYLEMLFEPVYNLTDPTPSVPASAPAPVSVVVEESKVPPVSVAASEVKVKVPSIPVAIAPAVVDTQPRETSTSPSASLDSSGVPEEEPPVTASHVAQPQALALHT